MLRETLAGLCFDNNIRAKLAKFFPQFRLHIYRQIEHRGRSRRRNHCSDQRRRRAPLAQYRRARQHAQKHAVSPPWFGVAHASPRKASTGSYFTALRIAVALPANVTATASVRTTGSRSGPTTSADPKIARPSSRAKNTP